MKVMKWIGETIKDTLIILLFCFVLPYAAAHTALHSFNSKHAIIIMPESDVKAVVVDVDRERAIKDFQRKNKK
jgi:hypothetical protein